MSSEVLAHYDRLLAEHYPWMATGGGYARGVADSLALFAQLGLRSGENAAAALDLGSGPGMQSAALLGAGYVRDAGFALEHGNTGPGGLVTLAGRRD